MADLFISKRLVIFPMSGNNTLETSDFADLHFFKVTEGALPSPTVFLWKKLLRNMKHIISCFLSKEFFSSRLRNFLHLWIFFKSIVFIKPVFLNSTDSTNKLLKDRISHQRRSVKNVLWKIQKQPPECSIKIAFCKNFATFTGK